MDICPQCRLLFREFFIFLITAYSALFILVIPWPVIFIIAAMQIWVSFGTATSVMTSLTLFVPVAALSYFSKNIFALYLPLVTWTLLTLSVRSGRQWAAGLSMIFSMSWAYFAMQADVSRVDIIFIVSSLATVFLAFPALKGKGKRIENIDIIVRSVTGNTMRAAEKFAAGAAEITKGDIKITDWEKEGLKAESIKGEGLAVAFPVRLFGTGWKFLKDIIKNLPRGNGKPAFIIYTAAIYPDMAAFILWTVLRLKDYDVKGMIWEAQWPLKIKSFSEKIKNAENDIIFECGGDFADGWRCGEPLTVLPSPFFIAGLLK